MAGRHSASRSDVRRARELRAAMTAAELCLWSRLRGELVEGYRFRRQVPMGSYVVDFACLKARLVIEIDGSQHFGPREQDDRRTTWLTARGFRVLRFWSTEVLKETESVLERIRTALLVPPPLIPPRKGEGEWDPLP